VVAVNRGRSRSITKPTRGVAGALVRKSGVMAIVVHGGEVSPGNPIRVRSPKTPHVVLAPVYVESQRADLDDRRGRSTRAGDRGGSFARR
jgi:MOSC domain-containing protein YiiM